MNTPAALRNLGHFAPVAFPPAAAALLLTVFRHKTAWTLEVFTRILLGITPGPGGRAVRKEFA